MCGDEFEREMDVSVRGVSVGAIDGVLFV